MDNYKIIIVSAVILLGLYLVCKNIQVRNPTDNGSVISEENSNTERCQENSESKSTTDEKNELFHEPRSETNAEWRLLRECWHSVDGLPQLVEDGNVFDNPQRRILLKASAEMYRDRNCDVEKTETTPEELGFEGIELPYEPQMAEVVMRSTVKVRAWLMRTAEEQEFSDIESEKSTHEVSSDEWIDRWEDDENHKEESEEEWDEISLGETEQPKIYEPVECNVLEVGEIWEEFLDRNTDRDPVQEEFEELEWIYAKDNDEMTNKDDRMSKPVETAEQQSSLDESNNERKFLEVFCAGNNDECQLEEAMKEFETEKISSEEREQMDKQCQTTDDLEYNDSFSTSSELSAESSFGRLSEGEQDSEMSCANDETSSEEKPRNKRRLRGKKSKARH